MTTSGPAPHHAPSHSAIGPLLTAKLHQVADPLSPEMNGRLTMLRRVGITVKIVDVSGAGRVGTTTLLELMSSRITLRDLVLTRVRDEVARWNAEPQTQRQLDWEQQADRAIEAFGRNGFFVLVDDRQVTELDEELELTADTDIRFVRLIQLVGG